MAAGPVSRILSAGVIRQDGHSSRPRITVRLKRPTRRFGAPSQHASGKPEFLPIWSCSVWGLPCPPHYWGGGALLPHLFTLTPPILDGAAAGQRSIQNGRGGIFSVALSVG